MTTLKKIADLAARSGPVLARGELDRAGISNRGLRRALAHGSLRRVRRGWYVAVGMTATNDELREICRTLGAVVSHETACQCHEIEVVGTPDELHAAVGRNRGRLVRAGVRIHRTEIAAEDRTEIDGVVVATVVRTLFDLARARPMAHAVASADSALRRGKVTKPELFAALARLTPGPGKKAVRSMIELCDARSESVLESLLRILLVRHGLTAPELQWVVRSRKGAWIGRVDLCWPDVWLVVEADGFEFHSARGEYRRDRRRGNALTVAGWGYLRFSWEDVVHDPAYVVATVRAALLDRDVLVAA